MHFYHRLLGTGKDFLESSPKPYRFALSLLSKLSCGQIYLLIRAFVSASWPLLWPATSWLFAHSLYAQNGSLGNETLGNGTQAKQAVVLDTMNISADTYRETQEIFEPIDQETLIEFEALLDDTEPREDLLSEDSLSENSPNESPSGELKEVITEDSEAKAVSAPEQLPAIPATPKSEAPMEGEPSEVGQSEVAEELSPEVAPGEDSEMSESEKNASEKNESEEVESLESIGTKPLFGKPDNVNRFTIALGNFSESPGDVQSDPDGGFNGFGVWPFIQGGIEFFPIRSTRFGFLTEVFVSLPKTSDDELMTKLFYGGHADLFYKVGSRLKLFLGISQYFLRLKSKTGGTVSLRNGPSGQTSNFFLSERARTSIFSTIDFGFRFDLIPSRLELESKLVLQRAFDSETKSESYIFGLRYLFGGKGSE